MSRTGTGPRRAIPWELRLYDAVGLPPLWIGLAIAALTCALAALNLWMAGRLKGVAATGVEGFVFEVVFALLFGYAPTAMVYGLRGSARDLEALRPLLPGSRRGWEALRAEVIGFTRLSLGVATLWGFALGLAVVLYPPGWVGGVPEVGDPIFRWVLVRNTLMFSLYGRTLFVDLAVARRFSRIGSDRVQVDLLDLTRLGPFARRGLRSVLLGVVLFSLASLLLLAPWASHVTALTLGLVFAGAAAALVLPVVGVHRRIREAKREEIDRVTRAVAGDRSALSDSRIAADAERAGLADLLAYRTYLASISEWPFDAPTMLRFTLYLAIPLGSWLGGAVVERLLGTALD